jgi:hypothetical protein
VKGRYHVETFRSHLPVENRFVVTEIRPGGEMLHSEFKELFFRGKLGFGVDVFKAVSLMPSALVPRRVAVESEELRRVILISSVVWVVGLPAGLISNLVLPAGVLMFQVVVVFFVINEVFAEALLRDSQFFDWAAEEQVLVLIAEPEADRPENLHWADCCHVEKDADRSINRCSSGMPP